MPRAVLAPLALALSLWHGPAATAEDIPVDLELLLAVDTSASINAAEFALQLKGLADAFRDPAVLAAIQGTGPQGIAVALMQWGHDFQDRMAVGWRQVRDAASAEAFARTIEISGRHFVGQGTSIAWALKRGARLFDDNGFVGRRRAIDVSSDGRNNSGIMPARMRDQLVAEGFTINALAIRDGDVLLDRYFAHNVIGGPGAFVIHAEDFADYPQAIRRKLEREIMGPPVALGPWPATQAATGWAAETLLYSRPSMATMPIQMAQIPTVSQPRPATPRPVGSHCVSSRIAAEPATLKSR